MLLSLYRRCTLANRMQALVLDILPRDAGNRQLSNCNPTFEFEDFGSESVEAAYFATHVLQLASVRRLLTSRCLVGQSHPCESAKTQTPPLTSFPQPSSRTYQPSFSLMPTVKV